MRSASRWTAVAGVLGLMLLAGVLFGFWPGLDRWISARFFDGAGFPAEKSALSQGLRLLVWDLSIAMALLAMVMAMLGLVGRGFWSIPARVWAFISAVYLLGPALLVNGILKAHWGRARPDTTVDFGGTQDFTPFWQPGTQCLRNCSFTSGEAASAAALAIALFALMPHLTRGWTRAGRIGYRLVAVLLPLTGALQRLLAGRHYASDVVFSVLFVALIALLLRAFSGRPVPPGPR